MRQKEKSEKERKVINCDPKYERPEIQTYSEEEIISSEVYLCTGDFY